MDEKSLIRALYGNSFIGRFCGIAFQSPIGGFATAYARLICRLMSGNQQILLEGKASLDAGLSDAECPYPPSVARGLWMLGRNERQREIAAARSKRRPT